jgi:hypothetical protein
MAHPRTPDLRQDGFILLRFALDHSPCLLELLLVIANRIADEDIGV